MDPFQFAERLLVLIDQGRTTATYKFAVLLALTDLCLEASDKHGRPPPSVTTDQLAQRVLEYYWPQQQPYGDAGGVILRQITGGELRIGTAIDRFRRSLPADSRLRLDRARSQSPEGFTRLIEDVKWVLVKMPLPRLQRLGATVDPFIYQIEWTDEVTKAAMTRDFDNTIRFLPGAAEHLIRMSPLLRPLIQRKWADLVAGLNAACVAERRLDEFLFGTSRMSLAPLRGPLLELQDGRCFYCLSTVESRSDVDHFIPWARHPDNSIQNLVLAHAGCNRSKSDHLVAPRHVRSWRERNQRMRGPLESIAAEATWESNAERSLAVARGTYLRLSPGTPLWSDGENFSPADMGELRSAVGT